jgi:branched-chain amino acid transport system ATP-binding protein
MLEAEELESGYGPSKVLFGLSLQVRKGEVVTMIGRNGMGKTTTIHTLMGVVRAKAATALFDGKPIHGLPPYKIARMGLGLVPEGRQIFPNLTVEENLIATSRGKGMWSLASVYTLFPRFVSLNEDAKSLIYQNATYCNPIPEQSAT